MKIHSYALVLTTLCSAATTAADLSDYVLTDVSAPEAALSTGCQDFVLTDERQGL